jgi:hypothetical protein
LVHANEKNPAKIDIVKAHGKSCPARHAELGERGSEVERIDDIIKRLAWAAKLYGGSRRNRECD